LVEILNNSFLYANFLIIIELFYFVYKAVF